MVCDKRAVSVVSEDGISLEGGRDNGGERVSSSSAGGRRKSEKRGGAEDNSAGGSAVYASYAIHRHTPGGPVHAPRPGDN